MAGHLCHVVKQSGGAASAVASDLVRLDLGFPPNSLFTDTLIEHRDLYRFLIEWCGYLYAADVSDLVPLVAELPEVWEDMDGRKAGLARLRMRVSARLPLLDWIADGRHPFEVFRDHRLMGTNRADPCSDVLKRHLSDELVAGVWRPDQVVLYVGLGHHERHRFLGGKGKRGIVHLGLPWIYRAPLIERPELTKAAILEWIRGVGIEPPQLYALGFATNNCGGACVKAGHAWWIHLLNTNRPYFLWWERQEIDFRRMVGKDVAILRDRRGGRTRPLPLFKLREMVEAQLDLTVLLIASDTGCGGGCALPTSWKGRRARSAA